jgi:hypothetical protein
MLYSKTQISPDKPWDWGGLSLNPNITFDVVLKNPDKPWNWGWLSRNPMPLQKKLWAVEKIED